MVFEIEDYKTLKNAVDCFCAFLSSKNVPAERVFDCKLVIYELLGNVLKHSGGKASLEGDLTNGYVELNLFAEKPFCPPDKTSCADVYAENGRGIFLIDNLCAERTFRSDGGLFIKIKI